MNFKACAGMIAGLLLCAGAAFGQESIGPNPYTGNAAAAKDGIGLYHSRCSGCHGMDASGGSGPNLVAFVNRGATDDRLYQTIQHGITGTPMPSFAASTSSDQTWKIVSYLLSLRSGGQSANLPKGPGADITWPDILGGLKNPARWLTYSGDVRGQRHSPLTQITPANVADLTAIWTFQTNDPGKFEASPIVIDGVIYITGPNNWAWAIDAKTGAQIWRYQRELPPEGPKTCCGTVNRGFAVLGGRLFMTTLDAHLIALDIRDGSVLWDATLGDFKKGYSATGAPLIVKDKVIAGVGGGEYGIRGSMQAFDPASGKRLWQVYTVPIAGEPGANTWSGESWKTGGAGAWATGSYDPDTDTLFWGTGNPGPDFDGTIREGDNLYSDSLLAIDPESGKLKWHFQFTPHDQHDWDSSHTPVIADIRIDGSPRKVVIVSDRNGFFYVLDRVTGKFILAKPLVKVDWATGFDANGRPILAPGHDPTPEGTETCPDLFGATNFMPTSFDPSLNLIFVSVRERCQSFSTFPEDYRPGEEYRRGGPTSLPLPEYGAVRAIDASTGERRWEFKYAHVGFPGVMSTASGLVFAGDANGNLHALDAQTGKDLWSYQLGWNPNGYETGVGIFAGPTTFMVGDRQYVLIPSGTTLTAFALRGR